MRSIPDGHIGLTRKSATQNNYPAIEVLASRSRRSRDLCASEQMDLAGQAREALALYRRNQDLINIGAYPANSHASIDHAIRRHEPMKKFLRQGVCEDFRAERSLRVLTQALVVQPVAARPVVTK